MINRINRPELQQLEQNPKLSLGWKLLDTRFVINDRWLKLRASKF